MGAAWTGIAVTPDGGTAPAVAVKGGLHGRRRCTQSYASEVQDGMKKQGRVELIEDWFEGVRHAIPQIQAERVGQQVV